MAQVSIQPKPVLVLFTQSYPYHVAVEQTFIAPEIEHLLTHFRVVLVPELTYGPRESVPGEVEVDESYGAVWASEFHNIHTISQALGSGLFYRELAEKRLLLIRLAALKRLVAFTGRAGIARAWVLQFLSRNKLDASRCLFYTYWLDSSALGIGLAKQDHPDIKLVSRAHGFDLYEERHTPPYIPCRRESLRRLDGLFPDSDSGSEYITTRYPGAVRLCETARLGVNDPGFVTSHSSDGIFRIVSCSLAVPVKRIDLLIKGIACAARQGPEQQFQWHHFGDGPLRSKLEAQARELPSNVQSWLPGYPSLAGLLTYYRDNPVDLFVNVSESEGTPVAVMEAISCGMPVVATAVGGNTEIVSQRNGKLISANPDPEEIAGALLDVWNHPDRAAEMRRASREIWQAKYNSERNLQAFADRLLAIRQQA